MRLPEVLRERNFRLLFAGQSVSVLGDGMVPVALAFAVLEVSDSPSALGIVLAARLVPTVVLLLAGGVVADRVSRRAVMVAADLVRLFSHAAMAAPARPFVSELREGWSEFVARDWVWGIVLSAAIGNTLAASYQVLGPVIAERELGGAGAWSTIATCFGVGSFLGASRSCAGGCTVRCSSPCSRCRSGRSPGACCRSPPPRTGSPPPRSSAAAA